MEEPFNIDMFLNMDTDEKRKYLNSLNENNLINVFYNISVIHLTLLDDKHLTMVLKDINIKKRILDLASSFLCGETSYNKLLERMTSEAFMTFMDEETFNLIIKSTKKDVIIKGILDSDNQQILNVLPKTLLMEYLVKNFNRLHHIFENVSESVACFFYDQILRYYPDSINIIVSLNSKNQWAIINHIGIYNFYNIISGKKLFLYLDDDVITLLIENEPFYSYFLNLDIKDISNFINQGVIIPDKFSRSKKFIDKISHISDPNEYRFLVNKLLHNSYNNIKRYKWKRLNRAFNHLDRNDLIEYGYEGEIENINILPIRIFEENFTSEYLEEEREKYYDNIICSVGRCEGLLPEFFKLYYKYYNNSDIDIIDDELISLIGKHSIKLDELYKAMCELTTTKLLEILVDRYYKDITYNFLINVKSVVNYFNSIDIDTLDIDVDGLRNRLDIYNKILNFYDMTREEQLEFYNSFSKNKNYATEFYEDFNLARTTAYNQYNDVVFNLEKDKNLLNIELSNELGVDIYELTGEPFYIYSHTTNIKRSEASQEVTLWNSTYENYLENPLVEEEKRTGASISLNGSKKIETFREVQDYVCFGFCHLKPERIAHVYHADSYSTYYNHGIGMDKINEIYTPSLLLDKTCKYNEILYQEISSIMFDEEIREKYEELKPDYLLCYDEVKLWDVNIAKRMGIPILVVYTKYYPYEKEDYHLYRHENEYIKSLMETQRIKTYSKK